MMLPPPSGRPRLLGPQARSPRPAARPGRGLEPRGGGANGVHQAGLRHLCRVRPGFLEAPYLEVARGGGGGSGRLRRLDAVDLHHPLPGQDRFVAVRGHVQHLLEQDAGFVVLALIAPGVGQPQQGRKQPSGLFAWRGRRGQRRSDRRSEPRPGGPTVPESCRSPSSTVGPRSPRRYPGPCPRPSRAGRSLRRPCPGCPGRRQAIAGAAPDPGAP